MPNYDQAPRLKYVGDKMQVINIEGFAQRSHDLESAIMKGLGPQDTAQLKLMFVLTANSEGFVLSEKTILERTGLSHAGYINSRRKLIEKGWLTLDGRTLYVNIDRILDLNTSILKENVNLNTSILEKKDLNTSIFEEKKNIDLNTSIFKGGINLNTSIFDEEDLKNLWQF